MQQAGTPLLTSLRSEEVSQYLPFCSLSFLLIRNSLCKLTSLVQSEDAEDEEETGPGWSSTQGSQSREVAARALVHIRLQKIEVCEK